MEGDLYNIISAIGVYYGLFTTAKFGFKEALIYKIRTSGSALEKEWLDRNKRKLEVFPFLPPIAGYLLFNKESDKFSGFDMRW